MFVLSVELPTSERVELERLGRMYSSLLFPTSVDGLEMYNGVVLVPNACSGIVFPFRGSSLW